ncbi:uncharacterized protein METZ01_LOCUS475003, partial [marine metagenome]
MRQVVTFVTVTLSTTVMTYNGATDIPSDPWHLSGRVATINDAINAGTATSTLIIQPLGRPPDSRHHHLMATFHSPSPSPRPHKVLATPSSKSSTAKIEPLT